MILEPRKREQIMPLPVVLISTIGKDGVRNAAPWSCVMPVLRPLDDIAIASWIKRDTLNNIRETGEFVVNVPTVDMIEAIVISSRDYPPDVDEFEKAGLKPRISQKVKAPGIDGCIAWAECSLVEEISRKNYSIVIGKVIHLEVNDSFFNKDGEMDYEKAKPLSVMLREKGMHFTYPVFTGKEMKYTEMFLSNKDQASVIEEEK
ncbi:flavin reductase family protein [Aceticella autotrophica]|uniref:Flavin reductase family protein n=1 Tax=Aceticella autotrophica TaxID=2755338 RepID=A0A975AUN5_9THEO|nr:flavin reductase family protein [Aceticella autotrophica]QSZ26775.1 flavin reductase family protein [Aceticella autotrophica]